MECQEARVFVSALHDGETVPKAAAEHIGECSLCRGLLREYAQMGAELRLLANATQEEARGPALAAPRRRAGRAWVGALARRVLVPRFALAIGVLAIVGLSVGLTVMKAQNAGSWFQFDVISPETQSSWGNQVQAGGEGSGFLPGGSQSEIVARVRVIGVQQDRVRLSIAAHRVAASEHSEGTSKAAMDQALAGATPREFDYVPGQTLEIPVEGGGKLQLIGRVLERPANQDLLELQKWYPLHPRPDQIAVKDAVLAQDKEIVASKVGSAGAHGANPGIGVYVPQQGLFVFTLHPLEGSVEGEAEFGEARFNLEGHVYTLFSATPIAAGDGPRPLWLYHDARFVWSTSSGQPSNQPTIMSSGDARTLLRRPSK